jgi:hypothetical protein
MHYTLVRNRFVHLPHVPQNAPKTSPKKAAMQ